MSVDNSLKFCEEAPALLDQHHGERNTHKIGFGHTSVHQGSGRPFKLGSLYQAPGLVTLVDDRTGGSSEYDATPRRYPFVTNMARMSLTVLSRE